MRFFRRVKFHGLVAVAPQDVASLGPGYGLTQEENALRRRRDDNATTSTADLPSSLASEPVSTATLLSSRAGVPSDASTLTSTADSLSSLAHSSSAAVTTPTAPAAPSITGNELSGQTSGSTLGVSGLLGGIGTPVSTQEAEPSTTIASVPESTAPQTPITSPTSVVVPLSSAVQAISSAPSTGLASSIGTSAARLVSVQSTPISIADVASTSALAQSAPTAVPEVTSTSAAPVPSGESATTPVAQSSSPIAPVLDSLSQSSPTEAATVTTQSFSAAAISGQVSNPGINVSSPSQVLSADPSSTPVIGVGAASPTSTKNLSTLASVSTIAPSVAANLKNPKLATSILTIGTKTGSAPGIIFPSAAADLDSPTLASSILTKVTKTGSHPGVITETTGSGVVVTETVRPSQGMSPGTMVMVVIGAAAGGLLVAAMILFFVRKLMRIRSMVNAESPPASPLLDTSFPPMSSEMPLRIEVAMHQRMLSEDSEFWVSGKGNEISEKEVEEHEYSMPTSWLPSLGRGHEMSAEMAMSGLGMVTSQREALKVFLNEDRSVEGKEVSPREL